MPPVADGEHRGRRLRGRGARRARAGATWIEMSTTDRHELIRVGGLAAERGIATLEAPVTGGVHLAATGELTVIVGGDPAVAEAHMPLFRAMGRRVFHVGPLGRGDRAEAHHEHARVRPPRGGRRGADARPSRRARPRTGVGGDRGELGDELRPRDRGPGDPERQLRHRVHARPGAQGSRARAAARRRHGRAARSRRAGRESVRGGARALRRLGVVADGGQAARGRSGRGPAGAGLSGHARAAE